jgi:hypothetical protein
MLILLGIFVLAAGFRLELPALGRLPMLLVGCGFALIALQIAGTYAHKALPSRPHRHR